MKTSLIVGMGIGQLYQDVLHSLGHGVITVDSNPEKKADFLTVQDAIKECKLFDTAHICTPNFTHYSLAEQLAPYTKIIFIEKPGVQSSQQWTQLIKTRPFTRFMMVKNNMWRDNISEMCEYAKDAELVDIMWLNKDRVPSPGSWFTTKELAFGGVSRDLMPHLLSLYIVMNNKWKIDTATSKGCRTNWTLEQLSQTDYGTVNTKGTYNVDDECYITYTNKWNLVANWRTNDFDSVGILFQMKDGSMNTVDLGLCPESAYKAMIEECISKIDDHQFWLNQYAIDTWIHEQIENL